MLPVWETTTGRCSRVSAHVCDGSRTARRVTFGRAIRHDSHSSGSSYERWPMLRLMPLSSAPCWCRVLPRRAHRLSLVPSQRRESPWELPAAGLAGSTATSSTTPACSSPESFARVRTSLLQPSSSRCSPSPRTRCSALCSTKLRICWNSPRFSRRRAPPYTTARPPHALLGMRNHNTWSFPQCSRPHLHHWTS